MHIDQQTTGMLRHMQAGSVRILWGLRKICGFGLLCLVCGGTSRAQPKAADPLRSCLDIKSLKKPIKSQQSINAMCRIDLVDLTCLPGLILKKDIELDIDLCLTADGRPVGQPRCAGRQAKIYTMDIIQRGTFAVISPDDRERQQKLDIPFHNRKPPRGAGSAAAHVQPGPDGCVYVRHTARHFIRLPPQLTPTEQGTKPKQTPQRAQTP